MDFKPNLFTLETYKAIPSMVLKGVYGNETYFRMCVNEV